MASIRLLVLALASISGPASAQQPSAAAIETALPDPETAAANRRILDQVERVAAQNREVAAATEQFRRDRARYEADLAENQQARAKSIADADAYRQTMADYAAKYGSGKGSPPRAEPARRDDGRADRGSIASSTPETRVARADIVVRGRREVCRTTNTAATGSLIARKPRQVCYKKQDLARNASEADRDVREMVTPRGGTIY